MTLAQIILGSVVLVLSVVLILCICIQQGKSRGLGAMGGGSDADTFFGKNKGRTMEAKLEKFTKIAGTAFFVLALISSLLVLFGV